VISPGWHVWPGRRYDHVVSIDDKPTILADIKGLLGVKSTTVFVRQGKYAQEAFPEGFTPDITVDHIADLQHVSKSRFLEPAHNSIALTRKL
jgi:hypothetical protein